MNKSQWKIGNGFVAVLFVFVSLSVLASMLLPAGTSKAKVMIIRTRTEERTMSTVLENQAMKIGGLTNIDGQFILATLSAIDDQSLFSTNSLLRTNVFGEIIDVWQTPYRIELIAPTNVIIQSAGKDKVFADADDIIFNSLSNDFIKP